MTGRPAPSYRGYCLNHRVSCNTIRRWRRRRTTDAASSSHPLVAGVRSPLPLPPSPWVAPEQTNKLRIIKRLFSCAAIPLNFGRWRRRRRSIWAAQRKIAAKWAQSFLQATIFPSNGITPESLGVSVGRVRDHRDHTGRGTRRRGNILCCARAHMTAGEAAPGRGHHAHARARRFILSACVVSLPSLRWRERGRGREGVEWSFYVVHSTRTAAPLNIPAHENRLARPLDAAPPEAVLQSLETVELSPEVRPSTDRPPARAPAFLGK